MLNPESLRKRAEEAAVRIERERQIEQERQRVDAERRRALEAERARWHALAKLHAANVIRQAIQAAARGGRKTQLTAEPALAEPLCTTLQGYGLGVAAAETSKWRITTEERIGNLLLKLPSDGPAASYKKQLTRLLASGRLNAEVLMQLFEDLRNDSDVVLGSDADTYLALTVRPHLEAWDAGDEPLRRITVTWKPLDPTDTRLSSLHHAPSWLLSAGGSGLMQQIGECTASDAANGRMQSAFELTMMAPNAARWGPNTMTKLVHHGRPIGVSPFPTEVLAQIIEVWGFKVVIGDRSPATLTISWQPAETRDDTA